MKSLGYALSLIGIAVVILSGQITSLSFLKAIPKIMIYTVGLGVILIIAGVFFLMDSSSGSQEVEVPVYDKSGKKIVGYRRTK